MALRLWEIGLRVCSMYLVVSAAHVGIDKVIIMPLVLIMIVQIRYDTTRYRSSDVACVNHIANKIRTSLILDTSTTFFSMQVCCLCKQKTFCMQTAN